MTEWRDIFDAPGYEVSDQGDVLNSTTGNLVSISHTLQGDPKVNLLVNGNRQTRSVRVLVAEAFCPKPNKLCNTVMVLNGDQRDLRSENLVWRPRWFVLTYVKQMKDADMMPKQYHDLAVHDIETGYQFRNILEAAQVEGLLPTDVWRSYVSGDKIFPLNGPFVRA